MSDRYSKGQFGADHQPYSNLTTDQKEKRKSPRFAFLIISASAHLAHLQSRTSQHTIQSSAKGPNFANANYYNFN